MEHATEFHHLLGKAFSNKGCRLPTTEHRKFNEYGRQHPKINVGSQHAYAAKLLYTVADWLRYMAEMLSFVPMIGDALILLSDECRACALGLLTETKL